MKAHKAKPRRQADAVLNWIAIYVRERQKPALDPTPPSALAGLIARISLVDDIDPALPANDAAILMARLRSLQRINDFHGPVLKYETRPEHKGRRFCCQGDSMRYKLLKSMD